MYYTFVNGMYVGKFNSIIDAREHLLNKSSNDRYMAYERKHKSAICTISTDRYGKNVVETMKWVSADLGHYPSPFMTRKTGERKWIGVTADGELFKETKNGTRYYERR